MKRGPVPARRANLAKKKTINTERRDAKCVATLASPPNRALTFQLEPDGRVGAARRRRHRHHVNLLFCKINSEKKLHSIQKCPRALKAADVTRNQFRNKKIQKKRLLRIVSVFIGAAPFGGEPRPRAPRGARHLPAPQTDRRSRDRRDGDKGATFQKRPSRNAAAPIELRAAAARGARLASRDRPTRRPHAAQSTSKTSRAKISKF